MSKLAIDCDECQGYGYRVIAWQGREPAEIETCRECYCFDCGGSHGEYELVMRSGQRQSVCIECAIESGDDNEASYRRHRARGLR